MANLFQRASLICPGESVSRPLRLFVAVMLSIILSLLCSAGRSEPLTMLLMPIERAETADAEHFTKARNFFPNLEFDNPEEQWQELNIGYHHWLCTELEKYAKEAGERIHIRFVSWNRALHDITETYRGGYDVLAVPSTWTAHLIDTKILAAWDDIDEANYPAQLLKTCRIEGEKDIYAVPWQSDLRVLFYRSDLTNNPDRLVTFKGFRECLEERRQQMLDSPGPTWQAPFGVSLDRNWDILHNLLGPFFGGHIIEKRQGEFNRILAYALGRSQWKAVFNTAQARKGFEKFLLLARDDLVHFTSSEQATGQIGWCNLAYGLIEGRYDAVIGGHYMRVLFDNRPDVDIRAAPLPQIIPGQPYSFMGGTHLAVAKAASQRGNEDLARELVLYLTRPEALIALSEKTDSLPAHNYAFNNFIQEYPHWEAFRTTLDFAHPYPSIPEWANKVENHTVLNSFSMLLNSIAKKESDSLVYVQLDRAAKKLQNSLCPAPRVTILVWVIVVVTIIIVTLFLISKRGRHLKPSEIIEEIINLLGDIEAEIKGALIESGKAAQEHTHIVLDRLSDICKKLETIEKNNLDSSSKLKIIIEALENLNDIRDTVDTSSDVSNQVSLLHEKICNLLQLFPPPQTVKLADLSLDVNVESIIPKRVNIHVTGPGIDYNGDIKGASAVWLIEGIRNRELSASFHTCTKEKWQKVDLIQNDSIPTLDASTRAVRRSRGDLRSVIFRAAGEKLPRLEVNDFLFKNISNTKYRYCLHQQCRVNSAIETARDQLYNLQSSSPQNRLDICLNALVNDPGSTLTCQILKGLVNQSPNPAQTQNLVQRQVTHDCQTKLKEVLLRNLTAANICYAVYQRDPTADVCGESAVMVGDRFAQGAESVVGVLDLLGLIHAAPQQPKWVDEVRNELNCHWLEQMVDYKNLEDPLCLVAVCNAKLWQQIGSYPNVTSGCRQDLQATSWFTTAQNLLTKAIPHLTVKQAQDTLWWWIELGLKDGSFPWLSKDAPKLARKLSRLAQ